MLGLVWKRSRMTRALMVPMNCLHNVPHRKSLTRTRASTIHILSSCLNFMAIRNFPARLPSELPAVAASNEATYTTSQDSCLVSPILFGGTRVQFVLGAGETDGSSPGWMAPGNRHCKGRQCRTPDGKAGRYGQGDRRHRLNGPARTETFVHRIANNPVGAFLVVVKCLRTHFRAWNFKPCNPPLVEEGASETGGV